MEDVILRIQGYRLLDRHQSLLICLQCSGSIALLLKQGSYLTAKKQGEPVPVTIVIFLQLDRMAQSLFRLPVGAQRLCELALLSEVVSSLFVRIIEVGMEDVILRIQGHRPLDCCTRLAVGLERLDLILLLSPQPCHSIKKQQKEIIPRAGAFFL